MLGNPRELITMAERRFLVRIRIAAPPGGFGRRQENCRHLTRRDGLWER